MFSTYNAPIPKKARTMADHEATASAAAPPPPPFLHTNHYNKKRKALPASPLAAEKQPPPKKKKSKSGQVSPAAATKKRKASSPAAERIVKRKIGQAPSTVSGYGPAIKLFDRYQTEVMNDPKLADLTEGQVEADNLFNLLSSFGSWMANTPIPNQNRVNKDKVLDVTTLGQYFGRVKEALRERFPDHEQFKLEDKEWWRDLLKSFLDEAKRVQRNGHDDYREAASRPVYKKVEPGLLRQKDGHWGELDGVDRISTKDGEMFRVSETGMDSFDVPFYCARRRSQVSTL